MKERERVNYCKTGAICTHFMFLEWFPNYQRLLKITMLNNSATAARPITPVATKYHDNWLIFYWGHHCATGSHICILLVTTAHIRTYSTGVVEVWCWLQIRLQFFIFKSSIHPLVSHHTLGDDKKRAIKVKVQMYRDGSNLEVHSLCRVEDQELLQEVLTVCRHVERYSVLPSQHTFSEFLW